MNRVELARNTLADNGYWYDQFGINELKTINYARK